MRHYFTVGCKLPSSECDTNADTASGRIGRLCNVTVEAIVIEA